MSQMAQSFGAAFQIPGLNVELRKPYEVTKLAGKVKKTVYKIETKKTGKFKQNGEEITRSKLVPMTVEEDAGYMVKFMNGHSNRVSAEELHRLGFDADPGLIDAISGQVFMPNMKRVAGQMELLSLLSPDYVGDEQAGDASVTLGEMAAKPKKAPVKKKPPVKKAVAKTNPVKEDDNALTS